VRGDGRGGWRGGWGGAGLPPLKSPELGAVFFVTEKNGAHAPLRERERGLAVISVAGVPLEGRKQGRSVASFRGQTEVQGQRPPTPRRLAPPGASASASVAAPGARRPPGRCRTAPISQCPSTTGRNEKKALPFPHHGNNAPQHGEAPAAFGALFHPHTDPASATQVKNKLTPPQCPRAQRYCTRVQPDAPPGQPPLRLAKAKNNKDLILITDSTRRITITIPHARWRG
jgi:hypothetical protein